MREFILRALKGRTSPDFSLSDLPGAGRLDLACRAVSNALWISNDLRRDTIVHICLDGGNCPPKIVSFDGAALKGLNPDERSIGGVIRTALKLGLHLNLGESREASPGVAVAKKSFETLVKEKAETSNLYYLHKDGEDLRTAGFGENACFVFGDNIGMPRKTELLLDRLGAKRITLGPVMLFASHCSLIIHNELDRR